MFKLKNQAKRKVVVVRGKVKSVAQIQKGINKKGAKLTIETFNQVGSSNKNLKLLSPPVTTGIAVLDDLLTAPNKGDHVDEGKGLGVPTGRVIEIYGAESTGKTSLALSIIKGFQKQGLVGAFVDVEHAFDAQYAKNIGLDLENLLFSQPECAEDAIDLIMLLAKEGTSVIVVDSVAALVPQAEIDGSARKMGMGLQARLMSAALRKLAGICSRSGSTVIFLNQIRMKIGIMFGNPEVTSGGNSLKFYASIRLELRRHKIIKVEGKAVASVTMVKSVKNKVAPPFREALMEMRYGKGITGFKWYDAKKREE